MRLRYHYHYRGRRAAHLVIEEFLTLAASPKHGTCVAGARARPPGVVVMGFRDMSASWKSSPIGKDPEVVRHYLGNAVATLTQNGSTFEMTIQTSPQCSAFQIVHAKRTPLSTKAESHPEEMNREGIPGRNTDGDRTGDVRGSPDFKAKFGHSTRSYSLDKECHGFRAGVPELQCRLVGRTVVPRSCSGHVREFKNNGGFNRTTFKLIERPVGGERL